MRDDKVYWCIVVFSGLLCLAMNFCSTVLVAQNISHRMKLSGSFTDKKLYQEIVIVNSYSNNERKLAITNVFKKILIRVTGQVGILENIEVKSAIEKPDNYLRQYSYEGGEQGASKKHRLKLIFDQVLVDQLISKAKFPILSGKRTNVLVLIAVDDQGDRYMINREGRSEGAAEILEAFQARAIPAFFPLWDIEDQRVRIAAVLGGVEDGLSQLAHRYYAKSFVVGTFLTKKQDDKLLYRGNISYELRQKKYTKEIEEATFEELKLTVVNLVSETLSNDYVTQTADNDKNENVKVVVNGMNALNKWDYLERRLKSISSVKSFKINKVSKAQLEVQVSILGDIQTFQNNILADKKLKKTSYMNIPIKNGGEKEASSDTYLHYYWNNEK